MNCEWTQKIHALHDGELSANVRALAEAHLCGCAECARELERVRRVGRFLNAGKSVAIDELAQMRVYKRVSDERNGRRVLRMTEWLTAAASVVLLTCGAALMSLHDNPVQPVYEPEYYSFSTPIDSDADDPAMMPISTPREYSRD